MSIHSFGFVYFVLAVLSAYYLIPARYRWMVLLTASYAFYATWKPFYLVYLAVPTLLVYFFSLKIRRFSSTPARKWMLILAIAAPLILLLTFKYLDLLVNTVRSIAGSGQPITINLLIPVGISFFTFRLISYAVDVYQDKITPERNVAIFALHVSFFPQLLAGPIERAGNFIPQLKRKIPWQITGIVSGLKLVLWGVFKKIVVADRLGMFVDQVFGDPSQYAGITLLFGLYFYAFQIYCDFSGYSDIAIGLSRMFGLKAMDNFNYPYYSQNLLQFWNRWHISLSTWLRDYLFLPMAYGVLKWVKREKAMGIKVEEWAYAGGIAITMFLGGLWHGASWTFVIWGMVHGFYLAFARLAKKLKRRTVRFLGLKRWPRIYKMVGILITFHMVTFAWVFFRAANLNTAISYLKNISLKPSSAGTVHLLFTLCFLLLFLVLEFFYKNRQRFQFLLKMPVELKIAVYVILVCCIILLSVDSGNEFIYFQF
jgi:D-alanyl-lipoteichoic acid acyltransferase DltB (MBOAT superfamily)